MIYLSRFNAVDAKRKNYLLHSSDLKFTTDHIISFYERCPRENVRLIIEGASFEDVEILLGFAF
jgi:hypothetical protein